MIYKDIIKRRRSRKELRKENSKLNDEFDQLVDKYEEAEKVIKKLSGERDFLAAQLISLEDQKNLVRTYLEDNSLRDIKEISGDNFEKAMHFLNWINDNGLDDDIDRMLDHLKVLFLLLEILPDT